MHCSPTRQARHDWVAVLPKFFEIEGRFPDRSEDVPAVAIDYVARQLGLAASALPNHS